mgnify:FL=1
MYKENISKIIVVLMFLSIIILAMTTAHFLNMDIESEEPQNIEEEYVREKYEFMGRKVFTIRDKNTEENTKYILYFHGGSYVAEATNNHWEFLKKIAKDTGYTIIMPDYPLTPKYNYKEVYNVVEPLYNQIIEKVGKSNLILMGDSAGGGLALGLYEKITQDNIETPAKTILISPWLDVRLENDNIKDVEKNDTILNKETLKLAGIAYAGNDGINSYMVNPIDGDLSKIENVEIFIGTYDILNPDCKLLKEKANEVGKDIEIKEYDQAKHIWLVDNNSSEEITQKAYKDLINSLKIN